MLLNCQYVTNSLTTPPPSHLSARAQQYIKSYFLSENCKIQKNRQKYPINNLLTYLFMASVLEALPRLPDLWMGNGTRGGPGDGLLVPDDGLLLPEKESYFTNY